VLIISIVIILASLALLVAGWWGRTVDGKRQRQRKWMMIALVALCVTFIVDLIVFVPRLRDHDWSRRKSTNWLLSDVESGAGLRQARAVNELVRRMAVKETPDEKIDPIIDRALAHQTDRSSDWDPIWATLIEAANDTKRLSKEKAKKYLENSVTASIEARPKVRRGQTMSVQLKWKIDRLSANSRLLTQFQGASLLLDSAPIAPDFVPASPGPGTELGSTYTRAVVLSDSVLTGLDDGPHRLATQVKVMMQQAKPFFTKPLTVNVPLSIPLQLMAKDAAIDEFKTNANQRDAVRAAVSTARVIHDAKPGIEVRVKATTLPSSLAMKVVLKQGATEEEAGAIVIDAAQPPRWHSIFGRKPVTLRGTVDVCLRPDPAAADLQRKLNTYWGEEIVIPAVVIDAPYQPPYLHDPSLRSEGRRVSPPKTHGRSRA